MSIILQRIRRVSRERLCINTHKFPLVTPSWNSTPIKPRPQNTSTPPCQKPNDELTCDIYIPAQHHAPGKDRYGLGIRFLRQEHATCYAKLHLPLPLPDGGDPDTELSTGAQEGLPVYASPSASQERAPPEAHRCDLCAKPFLVPAALMVCYHCDAAAHVRCLADRMLVEAGGDGSEVIPSEGRCWAPACARRLLWSRLVKGVRAYRPRSSGLEDQVPEDTPVESECGSGDVTVDEGPLVWRVDDSSDDEDGEHDDSGCDSEHVVREDGGGWSGGSVSRNDRESGEEEEEDDEFWKLSGCSQGRRGGGIGQSRRIPKARGESGRECKPSPLPFGRTQAATSRKCGKGQDSVEVGDTSDRRDSDSSDCEGGDHRREAQESPPRLPLAERLRLRRLGSCHEQAAGRV